eukprot:UC4_evm2s832
MEAVAESAATATAMEIDSDQVHEVSDEYEELERGRELEETDEDAALEHYRSLVKTTQVDNDVGVKIKEQSIQRLGKLYKNKNKSKDISALMQELRPFMAAISKAKSSKLFAGLLDDYLSCDGNSEQDQVDLCNECIEWAKADKRTYLRQSLELRLVRVMLEIGRYQDCLALESTLLKELKKLDDKPLLVEIQLLESRAYHALTNLPRARSALTASRTVATSIYTPPKVQAALDMQSGILHAEERDFKTSFSYFYEAFEGFDSIDDKRAPTALKYMMLCKIMLNTPEDVSSIVSGKLVLRYRSSEVEAMQAVAACCKNRSLEEYEKVLQRFENQLQKDILIKSHLERMYDIMLEANLLRIVEPFSRVEIEHVATKINRPVIDVERKLSQMILDKVLNGIIDQSDGVIEIFDETKNDETYTMTVKTIKDTDEVVESLYKKASQLF